jgi:hypothetical protein
MALNIHLFLNVSPPRKTSDDANEAPEETLHVALQHAKRPSRRSRMTIRFRARLSTKPA